MVLLVGLAAYVIVLEVLSRVISRRFETVWSTDGEGPALQSLGGPR